MWVEEDAFYPGTYFKETFDVHPEWNVASGICSSFLSSLSFFFWCVCHLDALIQTKQRIPGVQAFQEALVSFLKILKSNTLLIYPHPRRWLTGISAVTFNMRKVRKHKRPSQTPCTSLNTASSEIEIHLVKEICGFSSIFMSGLVVPWCWIPLRAALTRMGLMM